MCERERASESERSQSSERESASESERRERRERAPTHVTRGERERGVRGERERPLMSRVTMRVTGTVKRRHVTGTGKRRQGRRADKRRRGETRGEGGRVGGVRVGQGGLRVALETTPLLSVTSANFVASIAAAEM